MLLQWWPGFLQTCPSGNRSPPHPPHPPMHTQLTAIRALNVLYLSEGQPCRLPALPQCLCSLLRPPLLTRCSLRQASPFFCWPCPSLPLHVLAAPAVETLLHPGHQHVTSYAIALEWHSPLLTIPSPHMQALDRHCQSPCSVAGWGRMDRVTLKTSSVLLLSELPFIPHPSLRCCLPHGS